MDCVILLNAAPRIFDLVKHLRAERIEGPWPVQRHGCYVILTLFEYDVLVFSHAELLSRIVTSPQSSLRLQFLTSPPRSISAQRRQRCRECVRPASRPVKVLHARQVPGAKRARHAEVTLRAVPRS